MAGLEVLGAVAGGAQLVEQLSKIVHEIQRAAKDIKDVPVKTKNLIKQVEHVESSLNVLKVPGGKAQGDPKFLKLVLEELEFTLKKVKIKVDKFKLEDEKRERKNQTVEGVKNVFQLGGSKQKKKAEELSSELQKSLDKLHGALNVETRNNVIDIHEHVVSLNDRVAEIPKGIELVHSDLRLVIAEQSVSSKNNLVMLEKIALEITKSRSSETHEEFPAPAVKTENALIRQLHGAANIDEDSESRADVMVECSADKPLGWEVLEGQPAEDATGGDARRSSSYGGYRVQDGVSLRFTMSVDENRFFHFVTYSCSKPEAEPQLYFPIKSKTKHDIKGGRKRVFPNRSVSTKDPARFSLDKDGSSTYSSESVFLIFSRKSLVSAEAESKKSTVKLEISDVVKQLDQHLAKKLDDGADYDEIIVKHFKFDIFKD